MNDEQLIKEFEEKLNRERELDNINLDDFGLESLSVDFNQASLNNSNKEGNTECNRVCNETHPSLMSILAKKVKTQEELDLLEKEVCFVNVEYNDESVLILHTTLNQEVLAKSFAYRKENFLFDIDRYRYFVIDDDDDCIRIRITQENIYEHDEVISFINSVL